jgi:murein DD-endopeptidase MepM/ murein hydrolase activator NlpD
MGNPKYKSANIERKLQILGYAHNQGMGGAEDWLNTGVVGADGFGTKGTKYTDLIAKNFKAKKSGGNLQLAQGAVAVPSGGGGGSPDNNRPTAAGSPKDGKNRKIFLHWSAGGYNTPYSAYHSIVLGSGKKVQNTPYDKDKSGHTAGGNTNSVGLAVAAAAGATENNLKTPPTSKQLDVMTSEAANLAKSWGWTPAKVDSNVKTHGEWERYAVPAGILPPPVQRWDLDKLSQSDRFGSGGPKLRDMIKSKMSAMGMGGGKGNGGPVKKHKASEFILGGGRTLTSGMGMRDFALSPGMHMGIDISGKTGEPLQAFSDGVVEDTGYEADGYGNYVSWIDDKGIGHFYAHMNKPAFVRKGQRIKKGTILGELGSTGRSSGPHLHWEAATNPSDNGRSKSAVLSRFNPLSKYGIDAPFGGTIQPDPSMATQGPPGASPGSPGAPASPGTSSQPEDVSWIDPNFNIVGAPAKESYLQALRDGTYVKRQDTQNISQRTDSIMKTPEYANTGGNNILVMPMGAPSQQPMPSGGGVNSGGGFVSLGDMDSYSKSLDGVFVTAFYKN